MHPSSDHTDMERSNEVSYRIGPVDRPSEYHDLAGRDMGAVFAAARRSWPNEPLFCREEGFGAPLQGPASTQHWRDTVGQVSHANLN